jgi:dihydrofolate reductase
LRLSSARKSVRSSGLNFFLNSTEKPNLAKRRKSPEILACPGGFEPPTYGLEGRCSIRAELRADAYESKGNGPLGHFTSPEGRVAGFAPSLLDRSADRLCAPSRRPLGYLVASSVSIRREATMKRERHRKIIVYIATSADGYIARPDGGVEWLNRPRPKGNYGMGTFFRSIDAILWGRKTYDLGLEMGGGNLGVGPGVKNYVFSRRPPRSPAAGVEFVRAPIRDFAKRLRATPGKNIWMMGGGGIIGSFLDEGEIDEFDIHVIPIFIGEGIPLIAPRHRNVPLKLRSVSRYADGVVRLHYDVLGRGAASPKKNRPVR